MTQIQCKFLDHSPVMISVTPGETTVGELKEALHEKVESVAADNLILIKAGEGGVYKESNDHVFTQEEVDSFKGDNHAFMVIRGG